MGRGGGLVGVESALAPARGQEVREGRRGGPGLVPLDVLEGLEEADGANDGTLDEGRGGVREVVLDQGLFRLGGLFFCRKGGIGRRA